MCAIKIFYSLHDLQAVSSRILHTAKNSQLRFLREVGQSSVQASALGVRYSPFEKTPLSTNVLIAPRPDSLTNHGEEQRTTISGVTPLFCHAGRFTMLNFPSCMKKPGTTVTHISSQLFPLIFSF